MKRSVASVTVHHVLNVQFDIHLDEHLSNIDSDHEEVTSKYKIIYKTANKNTVGI